MTFKEYVLHQLREMRRELLTALEDVPEEDMSSFEPCGHWPIAWIAEHCSEVADKLLIKPVRGNHLLSYADHVQGWSKAAPEPGQPYPERAEIERRWQQVCDEAIGSVESLSEEGLQKNIGDRPYVQNVLLAINHTNAHLRSLWCILGERRLDHKFAEQQNYLA